MKNFITNNIVSIILIALLLIGGKFLYNKLQESNRYQDNYEQLLSKNNSKLLQLTRSEFKKMQKASGDTLLQQLMDSLHINFRHIERTVNHKYKYTYDTTITHLYQATPGVKSFYKKFDDCLSVSGKIDFKKDLLIFDKAQINYNETSVYFWEKKHKFIGIPFGRKQNFVKTTNNCNGITKTEEIKISKK